MKPWASSYLSETLARVKPKRMVRYQMPILRNGIRTWQTFEDIDTSRGMVDWPGTDYFQVILEAFLETGKGRSAQVGHAMSHLLPARELNQFAVEWMEQHFSQA